MQILYKQDYIEPLTLQMDLTEISLKQAIEKTRQALETAYAGFNNATDFEMIDSYIYEINALQQRYQYLSALAEKNALSTQETLRKHTPVRTWIARILHQTGPSVGQSGINRL